MMAFPDDLNIYSTVFISIGEDDRKGHRTAVGRGVAELLKGIRDTGSLLGAAKRLGMAYSKAWKLLGNVEEHLGLALIERDGARGSHLTPEGETLLSLYETVDNETRACAEKVFAREVAKSSSR